MSGSAGPTLTDRQRIAWLRLIRTPNVGPATFRDLVNRCGSAGQAIEALPDLARESGSRRDFRVPSVASAEAEIERAGRLGARFVALGEPDYPKHLRHIDHPPPLLAVRGDASVFDRPPVAIVGARNASASGAKFARMLAAALGGRGFAVVSGLARGIDTAAHRGSLATGTVGVLAGGLDRIYPPENEGLCDEIAARGGAIISEMPLGWEPRAQDFPRRNRLVAGSSLGLVVVEAATRSGSLISARLANEMGRTVFAVPGSPFDPRAAGCNRLLKDGATLVTDVRDVTDALEPIAGARPTPPASTGRGGFEDRDAPDPSASATAGERDRVIEALGPTPTSIDDVMDHAGVSAAQIALILLELDLAGRLERHSGGAVSLLLADA